MEYNGIEDFGGLARDCAARGRESDEWLNDREEVQRELVLVWGQLELAAAYAGREGTQELKQDVECLKWVRAIIRAEVGVH